MLVRQQQRATAAAAARDVSGKWYACALCGVRRRSPTRGVGTLLPL